MPTKTISLKLEAYEKLRAARRYPAESFSEVVLRARWPEETITAGELLTICRERGPLFGEEELERVERMKRADKPPEDKWKTRGGQVDSGDYVSHRLGKGAGEKTVQRGRPGRKVS